jgi:hypothetical protein
MTSEALAQIIAAIIAVVGGPLFLTWRRLRSSDVLDYRKRVALRTFDGKYVRADRESGRVTGAVTEAREWEVFRFVDPREPHATVSRRRFRNGSDVALQAGANGCFVGADLDHASVITARVRSVKTWEVFVIARSQGSPGVRRTLRYGDKLTLRAANGKFVRYDALGNGELAATVTEPGEWETFTLVDPKEAV